MIYTRNTMRIGVILLLTLGLYMPRVHTRLIPNEPVQKAIMYARDLPRAHDGSIIADEEIFKAKDDKPKPNDKDKDKPKPPKPGGDNNGGGSGDNSGGGSSDNNNEAALFAQLERRAAQVNRSELAFDRAEGFGARSQGGKGGRILRVTTLEDTGRSGSLRWAIEQNYPRIVQFAVAGTIELKSDLLIKNPFITIDGSTAPAGGIALKDGSLKIEYTHDVIIRYLRVRPGDSVALRKGRWARERRSSAPSDAISIKRSLYVMIDHCSASWGSDEVISATKCKNISVQWCFITEPLANPQLHIENGTPISHAYGSLVNGTISYTKNLFAYFKIRGPQFGNTDGFVNQLVAANNYVCFFEGSGTKIQPSEDPAHYQVINNVYDKLLRTQAPEIHVLRDAGNTDQEIAPNTKIYITGNRGPRRQSSRDDEWKLVTVEFDAATLARMKVTTPPFVIPDFLPMDTGRVAEVVLMCAGATLPKRDAVDARIVDQVKRGRGGLVDSQDDVGGYPDLMR